MKKILSILGTITLIGTSTTSLIACNNLDDDNYNISCEKENHGNWKQQCSNKRPFDIVDNKWYVVIWRGSIKYDWQITKFLNHKFSDIHGGTIDRTYDDNFSLQLVDTPLIRDIGIVKKTGYFWDRVTEWIKDNNGTYFKAVYRWDGKDEPKILIIDPKTGEVTDRKEDKEVKEDK